MAGEWRLVYRPLLGEYPMLSQVGKLLDSSGMPIDLSAGNQMQLVPAPDKPYKAPDKPWTREEALALARSVTGQTGEPASANYRESGGDQKFHTWNFSWQSEGKEMPGERFDVALDVERGVIRSYNSWRPPTPESGKEPGISADRAREAALQFMRATRPDLGGSLMIMPADDMHARYYGGKGGGVHPDYFIRFALLKSGVPVSGRDKLSHAEAWDHAGSGHGRVPEAPGAGTGLAAVLGAVPGSLKGAAISAAAGVGAGQQLHRGGDRCQDRRPA